MKFPRRMALANLPTKIEKLERLSKLLGGPDIYIKRDDQTGSEISGNKVRKLEFSIQEAVENGCNLLITCGGIQSNHARATAAAAARLGLKSVLVLRGDASVKPDGNYFVDLLLGAEVRFVSPEDYKYRRQEIMDAIAREMEERGDRPYIIPEGASNGIGSFGYLKAMEEIRYQEEEMGIHFDIIVSAVGSGGTYGGLWLGNRVLNNDARIVGVNICDNAEYFKDRISETIKESLKYLGENLNFSRDDISIVDGYVGRGYALSRPEELNFIRELAALEGIILDPVYTGKAMYGLAQEIKRGNFKDCKNILFIHTGGLFGLFPSRDGFGF